ncbi:2Fe-2S iron-sulfur cluster-binding protein [Nostoc sp.]|uniref:2Fe-2S iron-sulfur cluster-binding protein n=1 Tax=Nostoc sp. TaxID=1180 RepID=UPI002FFC185A
MTWQPSDGTILEFAEANDINPPFSCRVGVCGTCMCKIREGVVAYQEEPTARTDKGSVLICISQPGTAKLVLDI